MLNVFLTSDVEVWCNTLNDHSFSNSYNLHILGRVKEGDFGLPYQMKVMNDYGIKGVFFVEPLFASVYGIDPLANITGLVEEYGHETQLHIHAEWVKRNLDLLAYTPENIGRQVFNYSLKNQESLISKGIEYMNKVGAGKMNAFRAGNFGANNDTLVALEKNHISIDSSVNPARSSSKIDLGRTIYQREKIGGVVEYPMTVFEDYPGHLRHAQICACSTQEMKNILYKAVEAGWDSFVILSHSFELIDRTKGRVNKVVDKRFKELCRFLGENKDLFNCVGFNDVLNDEISDCQPQKHLSSNIVFTGKRMVEQLISNW